MNKLFDVFTAKRRNFIVKEKYMIEVLKMLDLALLTNRISKCQSGIYIGNCKWAEQTDSWYIHVELTDKQWRTLLLECKDKHYQLVIKDRDDNMHFEKI